MSKLILLRKALSINDLAAILKYQPKFLAYIAYKLPNRYTTFEIPKASGGVRTISAPRSELKALQKKVAALLQDALEDIAKELNLTSSLSHGFKRGHSIMTNADNHKRNRYVFNIDLENFFGSIHRGRVFGFLTTNRSFILHPSVARIIAQIVCDKDALPQGSPSSPVVSNLIGHLIDIRMVQFAKKYGCTYSRYADDITFSSNKKEFPTEIAFESSINVWEPSNKLLKIIQKSGFVVNPQKTRMQYQHSRQTVTGLIVNGKTHTSAEFRRNARAMAHNLFTTGSFHRHQSPAHEVQPENKATASISQLQGILSYIYMVDQFNITKIVDHSKKRVEDIPLTAIERTHRDFLFYKYFYANPKTMIICEGKTDNVYLKCAMKKLARSYPSLATIAADGSRSIKVDFMNYSELTHRMLGLNGGTGSISKLIRAYAASCKIYKHAPTSPTIIVVDNDSGAKSIYNAIKDETKSIYMISTPKGPKFDESRSFYYVAQNLYVVFTPLLNGKDSMMEDFFDSKTLNRRIDGRKFEVITKSPSGYSKHDFAQKVVKVNQRNIVFKGFRPILSSITAAISHNKSGAT